MWVLQKYTALKKWALRLGMIGALSTGIIQLAIKKNEDEYKRAWEELRDISRSGNKSFGLNYGFKIDLPIGEKLDTGDLLFMEMKCHKAFSATEMGYCYYAKLKKKIYMSFGYRSSNWDRTGILIKDQLGARVLFFSYHKLYDVDYDEFLRLPFFADIAFRRMKIEDPILGAVGCEYRARVHNEYLEQKKWFLPNIINETDLAIKYWAKTGLLEKFEQGEDRENARSIEDLDFNIPKGVNGKIVSYSEPIILRTCRN
ncbi:hypothetical protein SteCoe_2712 [Stentor coeruleus]|uniref:Uncharacterized protein n=1 Tax=Stentor coeruleus TaxID=5963 RepID=A0A1R2CYY5_9CILI|nr:hypothetical protein SteCoe_2712 [Stentor coeruleus]